MAGLFDRKVWGNIVFGLPKRRDDAGGGASPGAGSQSSGASGTSLPPHLQNIWNKPAFFKTHAYPDMSFAVRVLQDDYEKRLIEDHEKKERLKQEQAIEDTLLKQGWTPPGKGRQRGIGGSASPKKRRGAGGALTTGPGVDGGDDEDDDDDNISVEDLNPLLSIGIIERVCLKEAHMKITLGPEKGLGITLENAVDKIINDKDYKQKAWIDARNKLLGLSGSASRGMAAQRIVSSVILSAMARNADKL